MRRSCHGDDGQNARSLPNNQKKLRGGGDPSARSPRTTRHHTALLWVAMSRWRGGGSGGRGGWRDRSLVNRRHQPEESWSKGEDLCDQGVRGRESCGLEGPRAGLLGSELPK